MNEHFCEHETEVVRAARTDVWTPFLRTHVESCRGCQQALSLHRSLTAADQIPMVPDARSVWLKAEFAESQRRGVIVTQVAGAAYAILATVLGIGLYLLLSSPLTTSLGSLPSLELNSSSAPALVVFASILLALLLTIPSHKRSR